MRSLILIEESHSMMEADKGSSMELTKTADNPFEPISKLLFLDHPGFYHTASPAHRRLLPTPKSFAISGNVRSQHRSTQKKLNPERTRHEIIPSKTQANDSTLYLTPIATRVISVHHGNVVGGGVRGNAQPAEIIERP